MAFEVVHEVMERSDAVEVTFFQLSLLFFSPASLISLLPEKYREVECRGTKCWTSSRRSSFSFHFLHCSSVRLLSVEWARRHLSRFFKFFIFPFFISFLSFFWLNIYILQTSNCRCMYIRVTCALDEAVGKDTGVSFPVGRLETRELWRAAVLEGDGHAWRGVQVAYHHHRLRLSLPHLFFSFCSSIL